MEMSKEKLPQVYEKNKKVFTIPESFITDNPNNYTLGEKLRQMYNDRNNGYNTDTSLTMHIDNDEWEKENGR
jgi:hypothetical protein|tara:strand:+ start:546 stop:761 length:216 start_codon:yes stop_codon:yes gene_type:complete